MLFTNNHDKYILKQWIALKAHSDWLLQIGIFFAIHLQATRRGFAPENIVIVAGINELKSPFREKLSHCFSIY